MAPNQPDAGSQPPTETAGDDPYSAFEHMDAIDDLLSLGSASSAPQHQGLMGGSGAPPHPDSPGHWRLTNPVHMDLQENAKLPTFHLSVDRSIPAGRSRQGSAADEAQNSASSNANWTEMFFKSPNRLSVRANYQHAGELQEASILPPDKKVAAASGQRSRTTSKDHDGGGFEEEKKEHADSYGDASALLDSLVLPDDVIEPTPLSEMRERHRMFLKETSTDRRSDHLVGQRTEQLPIPTYKSDSPPPPLTTVTEGETTTTAVPLHATVAGETSTTINAVPPLCAHAAATAAAIAASTTGLVSKGAGVGATSGSKASNETKKKASSHPKQRPSAAAAAAWSLPPAVKDAASIKSQYGFGGNHKVPSVPQPPRSVSTKAKSSKKKSNPSRKRPATAAPASSNIRAAKTKRSAGTTTSSEHHRGGNANKAASPAPSSTSSVGGTFVPDSVAGLKAYERKKQRAKDARVRLNDSIERMAISIQVAGSQSNQRFQQCRRILQVPMPLPTPAEAATNPMPSHRYASMLKIMSDCVHMSNNAKKWDRPSFVGSAAMLIQGLNAQCESLSRALLKLHHETNASNSAEPLPERQPPPALTGKSSSDLASASSFSSIPLSDDDTGNGSAEKRRLSTVDESKEPASMDKSESPPSNKRRRVDESEGTSGDSQAKGQRTAQSSGSSPSAIFSDAKLLHRIAAFLDPLSLVRCQRVCKDWKEEGIFVDDMIWEAHCCRRFGFSNVRQWRAKLERQDENGEEDVSTLGPSSSQSLYRIMDAANVMPYYQNAGNLLLGQSNLRGKVSAWTFLVERSNGETLRSVRQDPSASSGKSGVYYASLPVVKLRTTIQNTGLHCEPVVIKEQSQTVDASTRRRGEEMKEIDWDVTFKKRILNLDGSERRPEPSLDGCQVLCRLNLFEAAVIETHIHARGCSTTSKFLQRAKFTKILVSLSGTTVPLVIPFPLYSKTSK